MANQLEEEFFKNNEKLIIKFQYNVKSLISGAFVVVTHTYFFIGNKILKHVPLPSTKSNHKSPPYCLIVENDK